MTYQRIEITADLPPAGPKDARTREKADIDFKRFGDVLKPAEMAKDIAALANQLGGVILIGADSESDKAQLSYTGVPSERTTEVIDQCERAATLCSPPQAVDVIPLTSLDGKGLVAVNVDAFAGQLVASPAFSSKDGGIIPDAWKFPIRQGSQTDFIAPENLAMYMNRQTRHVYVQLSSIPESVGSNVRLYFKPHQPDYRKVAGPTAMDGQVRLLPPSRNAFAFVESGRTVHIPLAHVEDIWLEQTNPDLWAITLSGTLFGGPGRLTYMPLLGRLWGKT